MKECKATFSPVDVSSRLILSTGMTELDALFCKAVGASMHLVNATHPDIAYAVDYVSRFIKNPRQ